MSYIFLSLLRSIGFVYFTVMEVIISKSFSLFGEGAAYLSKREKSKSPMLYEHNKENS